MDSLDKHYQDYVTKADSGTYDDGTGTSADYFVTGYTCPYCGRWVSPGEYHSCWNYPTYTCYPSVNKTEQAFKILKLLVKEDVIKEPRTFKRFCELIEKIAEVI